MKETGIIMSGNHPKLILDGIKTQTRRVIKNPDKYENIRECDFCCPYGQIGDRLWVRETWYVGRGYDRVKPSDLPTPTVKDTKGYITIKKGYITDRLKPDWAGIIRPSIFMPRWTSRMLLEITGLRAERLQEITEEDALAEGVNSFLIDKLKGGARYKMLKTYHHEFYPLVDHADEGEEVVFECPNMGFARLHHTQWREKQDPVFRIPVKEVFEYVGALDPDYKNGFRILWDSLNAKRGYSWKSNPWVWVISFKEITRLRNEN